MEPQKIFLQPNHGGGCQRNEDCAAGFLCALDTRTVGSQELTKGSCFRAGCDGDGDCDGGRCVRPLDGGPKICAPVPLPVEVHGACSIDADCRPSRSGGPCESDRDCDPHAECRKASSSAEKRCLDRGAVCSRFAGVKGCVRPSPCFAELQRYEIRAGRSFTSGRLHRQSADPTTGQCRVDTARSPLLASRIPIGPAVYPVLLGPRCTTPVTALATPSPNPCFETLSGSYGGFVEKEGNADVPLQEPPAGGGEPVVVRFSNTDIAFSMGVSHLSRPSSTSPEPARDAGVGDAGSSNGLAMPERGLTFRLSVISGYSALVVPGAANALALPVRLVDGPDGRVYVVDMGDRTGTTGTRGQVLRLTKDELAFEQFTVR